MRIFAIVSYLGTAYKGWQIQDNEPSIELEIENVLSQILNTPIKIYGSGRTDAGVHAKGQTFHFDIDKEVDVSKLKYSVNCLLKDDIHITDMKEVDTSFHARYSATGKMYRYSLNIGEYDPFINATTLYYPYPFDLNLFKSALALFVGQHDYRNFTSKEEDENDYIRTISNIDVDVIDNLVNVDITGDGFMRYMVRDIIGTCLEVASSKIDLSYIKERLDSKNRNITSCKAKSNGLTLLKVYY